MMELGLYEQLINKVILSKINELDKNKFFINESVIDKQEAARILSRYLSDRIQFSMGLLSGDNSIEKQIELANKIILLLRNELDNQIFEEDIIATEAKILNAIFSKIDPRFSDFEKYLKEITPYTRLSQSEL